MEIISLLANPYIGHRTKAGHTYESYVPATTSVPEADYRNPIIETILRAWLPGSWYAHLSAAARLSMCEPLAIVRELVVIS